MIMSKNQDEVTKLHNFFLTESIDGFGKIKEEFKVLIKKLKLVAASALVSPNRSKQSRVSSNQQNNDCSSIASFMT